MDHDACLQEGVCHPVNVVNHCSIRREIIFHEPNKLLDGLDYFGCSKQFEDLQVVKNLVEGLVYMVLDDCLVVVCESLSCIVEENGGTC